MDQVTGRTKDLIDPAMVGLILRNIADGVFTVDPGFHITYFNPAAQVITGFSAQEALGQPCFEVFRTPICGQDCPLRQSLQTGRTVEGFEIDVLTRDGRRRTISVSTAPLVDEQGKFLGGVETFRDVSSLRELRREFAGAHTLYDIASKNREMQQIFEMIPSVARSDAPVLVQGANGTGKDLLAAAIHEASARASHPLVRVNCSAVPESLLDGELFGQEDRNGRAFAANQGTLVLTEVSALSLPMQAKVLRLLESGEVRPPGADSTVKLDVRVIATTSRALEPLVASGRVRPDLFYRLNVIAIYVPDLAQRSEDIPLLVDHFLKRFNNRMGRNIRGVDEEVIGRLMHHDYAGNVRELQNVLEHAYVVARGSTITAADLPPYVTGEQQRPPGAPTAGAGERETILQVLQRNRWSILRAAQDLGMHRTTLWRKLKRLKISRP